MPKKHPKKFLEKLASITAKRPKVVIDHILKHGHVTTEELKTLYGYNHPPRAARDVREHGIVLETFRITDTQGRSIGAYRFGDSSNIKGGKLGGRKAWPKAFRGQLVERLGSRCGICHAEYEPRYLQIDHRVPYQVAGDQGGEPNIADFMLVCGSCNRAKSWSCEHCTNWTEVRDPKICQRCYWASPENYAHIALRLIRRLDVVWTEDEIAAYDRLKAMAEHARADLPAYVKRILGKHASQ